MFDVRAGISMNTTTLSRYKSLLAQTLTGATLVEVKHTNIFQLLNINIAPSVKLRLLPFPITTTYAPSVYLLAGVCGRYFTQNTVSYVEEILDSSKAKFIVNGIPSSRRDIFTDKPILEFNQLQFTPFLGLEAEIFLQNEYPSHWLLAPYARYYFASGTVNPQTMALSNMSAVQAGLTFKYRAFSLIK
jgi:hypothetical protein